MAKKHDAKRIENWIMRHFDKFEAKIREFYEEQTGNWLPKKLSSYEKKDLFDRWWFYTFFDRGFVQSDLKAYVDGFASGAPCELKYNTYGVDENECFIIDYQKIHGNPDKDIPPMPDDGRIVVLYFDDKAFYARQFLVGAIKRYGKIGGGGKVNNETCEESSKPEYWISHKRAEDVHVVWRKKGKKF